ncbi:uncharacterized protein CLAFUR5_13851 [Fulvia fulva]|uniref:Uncharacterized protein n=1 Tax=Passalora fulva TaxID=5499 RepID=A0A9Q8UVS8_PASFU|nr:uncharacterized protein CLAFUR5_13851 [Fulvia fulva]UJO24235.1 hypothetical protein CLAFUR5_13851 [Fulvia fulva]WPV36980.1 hypothetical protein CLAFUW7_14022 [Fulvia fulva]
MAEAEQSKQLQDERHIRSLAEIAEASLLKELKSCLRLQSRKAIFACGGTVNFTPDNKQKAALANGIGGIPSIDLRFGESGKGMTLTLPIQTDNSSQFTALLSACQPASFGRSNEEVFEEEYRKASKLDRTAFATNFCPYEAGIIDVVAQLLLSPSSQREHKRSIKAELYKLNVYGAPSGKFKAHVDTPRSEDQIGSLVVCLPLDHEGGQLVVRNSGKELTFDWSQRGDTDRPDVKWGSLLQRLRARSP